MGAKIVFAHLVSVCMNIAVVDLTLFIGKYAGFMCKNDKNGKYSFSTSFFSVEPQLAQLLVWIHPCINKSS